MMDWLSGVVVEAKERVLQCRDWLACLEFVFPVEKMGKWGQCEQENCNGLFSSLLIGLLRGSKASARGGGTIKPEESILPASKT